MLVNLTYRLVFILVWWILQMVPSLDEQHQVMIECVQNHTPDIIAIDEIGIPQYRLICLELVIVIWSFNIAI